MKMNVLFYAQSRSMDIEFYAQQKLHSAIFILASILSINN